MNLLLLALAVSMDKYRLQLISLAVVLISIIGTQFYWVKKTVQLQQQKTAIELQPDLIQLIQYMEDNYYCFKSYSKTRIHENSRFSLRLPDELGVSDSLTFNSKNGHELDTSEVSKYIDIPFPAQVQIEMNFEFDEPSREIPIDRLTETQKRVLKAFERYIRVEDMPTVDTVTLKERILLLNGKLPDGIFIGLEIINPANNNIIYHWGSDIDKAFGKSMLTLNNQSVFLHKLDFRFLFFDKRPFYNSLNVWALIVSLLLLAVLLLILILFFRSFSQQKKMIELRNELLANITHEFNTPVTNIALALKSLRPFDERSIRAAEIIKEENERIKQNVDIIMSAASLHNDIAALDLKALHFHSCIEMVSDVIKEQINASNGTLSLSLQATSDYILGDEIHLINVLHNLVDNAIKYSDESPIIDIRTRIENKKLLVEISDNGIGISKENHSMVFEKFYRVPNQFRHENKGFGFGLHYVKLVIEQHGGSISIRSKLGEGSTFTLYMPLKRDTNV